MKQIHIFEDGEIAISDSMSTMKVSIQAISMENGRQIPEAIEITKTEFTKLKRDKALNGDREELLNVIIRRGKKDMNTSIKESLK